jgi:zinc transport system substrate-binding protein
MTMANTIHDELVRLDPAGRPTYDRNARALQADLRAVDRRLRAELAPLRGTDILTFHPSFAYFAQAYGLRQVAIETQGKDPDARRLGEIIRQAQARGAKAIFVEPASPSLSAEVVAREIGGVTVELDPLARDYLSNLQRIAAALLQQHQADRVH